MSAGPIFPCSAYPADTSGRIFPDFYAGGGGNAAAHKEGWHVIASLDADTTLELVFQMPPTIPGGTLKLLSRAQANATSGDAKFTVSDGAAGNGASDSAATLTAEDQTTHTWAAGGDDDNNDQKIALSAAPAGNDDLIVAVKFQSSGWTLAAVANFAFSVIWE